MSAGSPPSPISRCQRAAASSAAEPSWYCVMTDFARMLAGGKMLHYGAKAIPEGGLFSQPKYYGDGFLIIGDAASFLNSMKLKGIHMAMKTGMLAAEAIYDALKAGRYDEQQLHRFEHLVKESYIYKELYQVRNFHQAFEYGQLAGMFNAGAGMITRGRGQVLS